MATLTDSTLSANTATGGRGGNGSPGGIGGGQIAGGVGGSGGAAAGGGLDALNGTFTLSGSTIANNRASGGGGGSGGQGGRGISASGGAGGDGGAGGYGQGAGLYTSASGVTLTNVTIAFNTVMGGTGGPGGAGGNGGDFSTGVGGNGGNGGQGGVVQGGGLFVNSGTVDVRNSTVARNKARTGVGGTPGMGGAGSTAGRNGSPGISFAGGGGGVWNGSFGNSGTVNATNSLFALNTASGGPDFNGLFNTASHNLLGDGTGSNLAPANPDANGNIVGSSTMPINPKLGPLANNGGPTQTMALLSGSPAIDAGTATGAPATDQRGVARENPPDIGAYEFIPAAGSRANGSRAAPGAQGIDPIWTGLHSGDLNHVPATDDRIQRKTAALRAVLEAALAEWSPTDVDSPGQIDPLVSTTGDGRDGTSFLDTIALHMVSPS
jgi:hypothetical protein